MKTSQWIPILTLVAAAGAGCGNYSKNPVPDLQQMRADGTAEQNRGPDKPREITHNVIVEKPVPVYRDQTKVDDNFLVISPDSAEMVFTEGQKSVFTIHARALQPGVKVKLTAKSLPDGAMLVATPTATDADIYTLSWNVPLYTIATNSAVKTVKFRLVAQVSAVSADQSNKGFEGLVREKEITAQVFRNLTPPSDLTLTNLPSEVAEGTVTPFEVTVKVPGIDGKTPQKPVLIISYDRQNLSAGNDYQEQNGSLYVISDVNQKEAVYVGDSKWTFHLAFDTKNIAVQQPLAAAGTALTDAIATHVRLSFKVANSAGGATPEFLKQLKINLNKPPAAPRFDLSGLAKEVLELTPGQKTKLNFFVASGDSSAKLAVTLPDLKTLPGAPVLKCAPSAKIAARQDCSLEWAVPCTATEHDLTQDIQMSAVATSSGKNSEPTNQTLKTVAAKAAASCTAPVKPATPVKPAAPATPAAPTQSVQPATKGTNA